MRRTALVAVGMALMLGTMTIDAVACLCDDNSPFRWLCGRTNAASAPQAEQSAGTPEAKQPAARPQPRSKKSTETTGAKKDASAQRGPQLAGRLQHDFEEFLTERARRPGGNRSTRQPEDQEALFREFMQWQKDRPSSRSR
jgi:hypothetical protein